MPGVTHVTVTEAESGQKLLQFLIRRTGVPKGAIQRWIRKGDVRVDKKRSNPFDRINKGQIVRIPPHDPQANGESQRFGPLDIVFSNKHVVAVAKPAGLVSHGGDGHSDSVTARLVGMYKDADFTPALAHRLDRDTSGLMLAGKSYRGLRRLNDMFKSGEIGKIYLAWVSGQWPYDTIVEFEDEMEKTGKPGEEKVTTGSGKLARSKVMPLDIGEKASLLAVRLITGRTHQIRVQLAERGHPILGDVKYGSAQKPRLMLHCAMLTLPDLCLTLAPPWPEEFMVEPPQGYLMQLMY